MIVRLGTVKARLGNIKTKLGKVKTRFENVKTQRFFSKANKAKHLQLYLPERDGNIIEH